MKRVQCVRVKNKGNERGEKTMREKESKEERREERVRETGNGNEV